MAKASDNEFPSVLFTEGSAPADPAAGNQRLFIDSADHKVKRVNSSGTVTVIEGGGSSSGGILGVKAYNPGTLASYTTTSATASDVDATNLAVTFTVPASGQVLVTMTALSGYNSTGGGGEMDWVVRSGSSTVAGPNQVSGAAETANRSYTTSFLVTGLTSGASLTYKWGWAANGGTANTCRLFAGGVAGQAVMKVEAA